MNYVPEIFDRILKDDLRPWLDENKPDEKFASKISEVQVFESDVHQIYKYDFIRHFNYKTEYYYKLISNEFEKYNASIINQIIEEDDIRVKKYILNDTLKKKLATRLKDIGRLINERDYPLNYIDLRHTTINKDTDHKTETYCIQFLKTAIIKSYMEIQECYRSISPDLLFEIQDIYIRYIHEPIPGNTFLKEIPKHISITLTEQSKVDIIPNNTIEIENTKPFILKKADFRSGYTGKFDYDSIDKKHIFEKIEEFLFEYEFIDENYNFTNKHNKKKELATIYHLLIDNKCFKKRNFKHNQRDFEGYEYRKYLDHRYNVNTSQEFSRCNSETKLSTKTKYYFLDSTLK